VAEEKKKVQKKIGNPNWYPGMPHPEGAGRPKGLKDSVFAPRQQKKRGSLFWANLDKCAKRDGFTNIEDWLWKEAQTDPEFKALLQRIMLDKLGTPEVGDVQQDMALKGMTRDVMVAEAQASGEGGGSGNTVNVIMPPVLQATEHMRRVDQIDAIEVEALPMDADPEEGEEAEEG